MAAPKPAHGVSSYWRLYINGRDGAGIWTAGRFHPLPAGRVHVVPAYMRFCCHNTRQVQHLYGHFDLLGVAPLLQKQLFAEPTAPPCTQLSTPLTSPPPR